MPKMVDIQNGAYVALEGALTTERILAFGLLRSLRRWLKLEQRLTEIPKISLRDCENARYSNGILAGG